MYIDSLAKFSDGQALAATAVSTNVYDDLIADGAGTGEPLAVMFSIIVAADSTTGDETYEFQIQSGSTDTPTDVIAKVGFGGTNELAETLLVAGYRVILPIPPGTTVDRFLRINYVLGGTSPTVTVSAHLMPQNFVQNEFAGGHADNITIL